MVFPFQAIVGQAELKKALLIAAINSKVGGVLIVGEKGTAKSTAVCGLAEVLSKSSIVELPLNATEDMIFGSLDINQAIQQGTRSFSPGLLARANNNILYVDEINLLRSDLANAILDTAVSGVNLIEREGLSYRHAANFIMIGTMNPEEGNLTPQLLDRFGMYVNVEGEQDVTARVEVVKRILEYEANKADFTQRFSGETSILYQQIMQAKKLLPSVEISEAILQLIGQVCAQANCAGHRGELFTLEAAKAIAVLAKRNYIMPEDIYEAAKFTLPHRMRKQSPDMPQNNNEEQSDYNDIEQEQNNDSAPPNNEPDNQTQVPPDNNDDEQSTEEQSSENEIESQDDKQNPEQGESKEQTDKIGKIPPLGKIVVNIKGRQDGASGKRSTTRTNTKQGRYIAAQSSKPQDIDLALAPTLRAAAPYQAIRPQGSCFMNIYNQDFRYKIREKRIGNTFLFVVDASGSMGAKKRMQAVKGAILAMLNEAYQKRDKVGMIAFRRISAEVLLPVTRSVDLAYKCLEHLPTGGKTPLAEGLYITQEVITRLLRQDKDNQPIVVLITDGRTNKQKAGQDAVAEALTAARQIGEAGIYSLVIDTEQDFIKLGIAPQLAQAMGGTYYKLNELSANSIIHIIDNIR